MALNNFFAPIAPEKLTNFKSAMAVTGFDSTNPVSSARYPLSDAGYSNAPILVPDASTGASIIHTCDIDAIDEVFLWCGNFSSTDCTLTLGIGGTSDYQTIIIEVPKNSGLVQVYPGVPHSNISIYVKASAIDSLNMIGFVTRKYLNVAGETEFGYDASE
tara:strand:+ start:449 stop:928 length:480 start_codon:yes stop_codon:yes gene_type:complete